MTGIWTRAAVPVSEDSAEGPRAPRTRGMINVEEGDIRAVQSTVFGGGHGVPEGPGWAQGRRPGPEKKRLDQVQFTEPRRATLQLLRERILENTRVALDLPDNYTGPRFITREVERAGLFVNRLLSDQNLLASRRGGDWSPEQIRDALETGMTLGMAETLEILFELDELDETSWALVCDILDAFHRKVESAC